VSLLSFFLSFAKGRLGVTLSLFFVAGHRSFVLAAVPVVVVVVLLCLRVVLEVVVVHWSVVWSDEAGYGEARLLFLVSALGVGPCVFFGEEVAVVLG